ncbi:helix-turn-helix domain-containing protein [Streptomyces sp. NPDC001404]|uniref:helix-turn-helix domain-containing protein n=1 Tax=Streptomyces sp. NPDC001404 TaxID=3364571 RepID=UPI0036AAED7A
MPDTSEQTFATELRRLRGTMTLRDLARRACCSKSLIYDLEHERRSPTPQIARALDNALGAGGKLVLLAEAQRQRSSEEDATAPRSAVDDLLREWDDVLRRDFLKKSAGAIGAAAVANLGISSTTASSHELMDAHLALRAAHGRLDNLRGASAVYAQAVDHHRQVLAWHSAARTAAERQQIAALAADTGGFVGFLTYDLGMAENAATHYRDAAGHARYAGDLSCCTNLIGQMSRILADQGHYRRALDLADGALRLSGTKAHPAVRSWLHAVRAHHHACLNDARASQDDLSSSWALLERADDGEKPPYMGYLSAAELGKWTGHAMVRLGSTAPAFLATGKSALDEARATWPAAIVRGSAEMLTASARIYAARGDRDEAADLVSRSIAVATATGSARNLRAALTAQAHVAAGGI